MRVSVGDKFESGISESKLFELVENIVEKGEKAGCQHLSFSQIAQNVQSNLTDSPSASMHSILTKADLEIAISSTYHKLPFSPYFI